MITLIYFLSQFFCLCSSFFRLIDIGKSLYRFIQNYWLVPRSSNSDWIYDFLSSSGTFSRPGGSKKHVSSKIVVVILLICVICTTMAFLVSLICHVYRKDRCTIHSPIFSMDKETSSGSTTNLISHRSGTSSVPETKYAMNSPIYHITG